MSASAQVQQTSQLYLQLQENQLQALDKVLQTPLPAVLTGQGNDAALASPCGLTVASLAKALLKENSGAAFYLVGSTVAHVLAETTHMQPKDIDLVLVLNQDSGIVPKADKESIKYSELLDPVIELLQALVSNSFFGSNRVRVIARNKGLIKITDGSQSSSQNNNQGSVPVDLLVQRHAAPFEYDEMANSRRIQFFWQDDILIAQCQSEWPHTVINAMQEARLLWFAPMNQDGLYRALKAMLKAEMDGQGTYFLCQHSMLQTLCEQLFTGVKNEKAMQQNQGPYLFAALKMVLGTLDGTYFNLFFKEDVKGLLKPHFDALCNLAIVLLKKSNVKVGDMCWVAVNVNNTKQGLALKRKQGMGIDVDDAKKLTPFGVQIVRSIFLGGNGQPLDFVLSFQKSMMGIARVLDNANQQQIKENVTHLLERCKHVAAADGDLSMQHWRSTWHFFLDCQYGTNSVLNHLMANPDSVQPRFAMNWLASGVNHQDGGAPFATVLSLMEGVFTQYAQETRKLMPWVHAFIETVLAKQWLLNPDWTVFFKQIKTWVACLNAMGVRLEGCFAQFPQIVSSECVLDTTTQGVLESLFDNASLLIALQTLPAWIKRIFHQGVNQEWFFSDLETDFVMHRPFSGVIQCTYTRRNLDVQGEQETVVVLRKNIHRFSCTLNKEQQLKKFQHNDTLQFDVRVIGDKTQVRCYLSNFFSPTLTFFSDCNQKIFANVALFVDMFRTIKAAGAKFDRTCPWGFVLKRMIAAHGGESNGLVLHHASNNKYFSGFLNTKLEGFSVALGWLCKGDSHNSVEIFGLFVKVDPACYSQTLQKQLKAEGFGISEPLSGANKQLFVPHGFQVGYGADGLQARNFFVFGCKPGEVFHGSVQKAQEASLEALVTLEKNNLIWQPLMFNPEGKAFVYVEGRHILYGDYHMPTPDLSSVKLLVTRWRGSYCIECVANQTDLDFFEKNTLLGYGIVLVDQLNVMEFKVYWHDAKNCRINFLQANAWHTCYFNVHGVSPVKASNSSTLEALETLGIHGGLGLMKNAARHIYDQYIPNKQNKMGRKREFFYLIGVCFMAYVFVSVLEKMQGSPLGRSQV